MPVPASSMSFREPCASPWASPACSTHVQEADIPGARSAVPESSWTRSFPHLGSHRTPHEGPGPLLLGPPPGLEQVLASINSPHCPATRSEEQPPVPMPQVGFNKGSFGHPQLCGRPCIQLAKGGKCPSGMSCTYCHFLPHAAVAKPGFLAHQALLAATDQELLATFLPFIRKKATKEGLLPLVTDLINLLEAEVKEPRPESIPLGSFRPMRMTFMHLVERSMRRLPLYIKEEVQRLKATMPPPTLTLGSRGVSLVL
ncbi:unnamed protein product [Symbiodinium natans]|uniref:C3H1-type domain-containing protein n=1 Tax=Symbiodinium natans TaxID=878477 RepID=A0A812Q886_9DINO|nr:unnamed protein product [Symbiodinium natans]